MDWLIFIHGKHTGLSKYAVRYLGGVKGGESEREGGLRVVTKER